MEPTPKTGSVRQSKRFKKKTIETAAEMLAGYNPDSTVTIVVESDNERIEVVRGVVRFKKGGAEGAMKARNHLTFTDKTSARYR